jgi:leader peptidase (prepilin peptidase)/N-methyltransferase
LIEVLNGVLYIMIFIRCGIAVETVLYCLLASALLALSVIDFRTYEIPVGINIFIACLGVVRIVTDLTHFPQYLIGALAVSVPLLILYVISKGRAIGGGDVKLMAAAGLVIGWQNIILAFVLGCILGSVIHVARMKISKADHQLALGPYLAAGILISALYGQSMISWYLTLYM